MLRVVPKAYTVLRCRPAIARPDDGRMDGWTDGPTDGPTDATGDNDDDNDDDAAVPTPTRSCASVSGHRSWPTSHSAGLPVRVHALGPGIRPAHTHVHARVCAHARTLAWAYVFAQAWHSYMPCPQACMHARICACTHVHMNCTLACMHLQPEPTSPRCDVRHGQASALRGLLDRGNGAKGLWAMRWIEATTLVYGLDDDAHNGWP